MLKADAQDDVTRLCRLVRMDPSAYIRFELPAIALLASAESIAPLTAADKYPEGAAEMLESPARTTFFNPERAIAGPENGAGTVPATKPAAEPHQDSPAIPSDASRAITKLPLNAPQRYPGESGLEYDLAALACVHESRLHSPTVLPLASAVAGGGVTTLLAVLGRALSIMGDRVLLVDANAPSALDYFYRGHTQESGFLLSTLTSNSFEGQLHLLRTDTNAPSSPQGWSTRVHRALAELRGNCDRILVAGRYAFTPALTQQARANGVCLLVLTPELRSLLALPSILRMFDEGSEGAAINLKPFFVLNRFNECNPAHAEIRERFAEELGARLLPVCIPESPVVAQALANGVTPLDLAPQSPFTEACFGLAEWYRAQFNDMKALSSQPEENQLVSD